jgi:hypothetical protein
MDAKCSDTEGEIFVGFDSIKNIHRTINLFWLILPKVEVDCIKDMVESD